MLERKEDMLQFKEIIQKDKWKIASESDKKPELIVEGQGVVQFFNSQPEKKFQVTLEDKNQRIDLIVEDKVTLLLNGVEVSSGDFFQTNHSGNTGDELTPYWVSLDSMNKALR